MQAEPTLRLRVDTAALAQNWRALDKLSGSARTGAAVKAQCYGLGVDTCVPALREAGCETFFVAHWSEVEDVAHHVAGSQIAVLHGPLHASDVEFARGTGAMPVINSIEQAKLWLSCGGGLCHLMVDTGMNRLGLSLGDLPDPVIQSLEVDTLLSHLACADEDHALNEAQLARFRDCRGSIGHNSASLANSAGIGLGQEYAFDLTRPGLALYGGVPRPELSDHIAQVCFVDAAIIQVRAIEAGETVGYNAKFTAPGPMRVGTVSLGYADGFLLNRGGSALRRGDDLLPILGKVSMDMVVVDLTNVPDIVEGDWLEVPYHLPDAAQQSTLSQYELLTVLGHRL